MQKAPEIGAFCFWRCGQALNGPVCARLLALPASEQRRRSDLLSKFAEHMTTVFEADLLAAESYSHARWKIRPMHEKITEKFVLPIKSQL